MSSSTHLSVLSRLTARLGHGLSSSSQSSVISTVNSASSAQTVFYKSFKTAAFRPNPNQSTRDSSFLYQKVGQIQRIINPINSDKMLFSSSALAPSAVTNTENGNVSSRLPASPDIVFVRDLFVKALTGVDAWHRPEPQPVKISIWLRTSVAQAGSTDHLAYSLNYAVITRKVTQMVEKGRFKTLEDIAEHVARIVLGDTVGGQWAKIQVCKPRALLRADASEIVITRQRIDNAPVNPLARNQSANKNGSGDNSSVVSLSGDKFDVVKVPDVVDTVRIHNLRLVTIIGVNTIERLHKQNVILDLTLYKTNNTRFGVEPGMFDKTYDFRKVVQTVTDHVEDSSYKTVEAFVTSVAEVICSLGVSKVTVRAEKPSALTFADAAGVEVTRTKQYFDSLKKPGQQAVYEETVNKDHAAINSTSGEGQAKALFPDSGPISESSDENSPASVSSANGQTHTVYIAFGSNIGDSLSIIKNSVEELNKNGVQVLETSSIYQSDPMYVKDQPKFYNGVFKAQTALSPLQLLETLKNIEYGNFGNRVKLQDNGPRTIDLDILLYDDWALNHPPTLIVPHLRMLERNFVLRPLADVVSPEMVHPLTAEPLHSHLEQLLSTASNGTVGEESTQESTVLQLVVPLPGHETGNNNRSISFDPETQTCPTHVMAILNITTNSFSDGGRFTSEEADTVDVEKISEAALKAVQDGATILDIGGMSTKPGTSESSVSPELEAKRVVAASKAIRTKASASNQDVVISIDTYRASVAEKAIVEGQADIINDISGGLLDKDMFSTVAKLGVPIIINHTRGTPETMTRPEFSTYVWTNNLGDVETDTVDAVVECVGQELEARVSEALASGIKRWQIILDPGIGFAKSLKHNIILIKHLNRLKARPALRGFAWLVGPSRKKFIGTLIGEEGKEKSLPKDRIWGTAATVSALIEKGVDIVRVHDVPEMVDVVKVSDAIFKNI